MSSISSHEESNVEDVDDLDHLVENDGFEDENQPQEETRPANTDDEAQEAPAAKETKPKRVVKNPQPKLNAETLKGPRGIHTLPQVFEKVHFKGKGYEEQDLNLLMKTYEYWCHRLFPKFSFDDCLARIEKLGYKKPVQTHIKKIRMDLLTDEPAAQVASNDEANLSDDQLDDATLSHDEPIQLTEEQLERIRLNKEKALKRLQDAKNAAANSLANAQQENFEEIREENSSVEVAEATAFSNVSENVQNGALEEQKNLETQGINTEHSEAVEMEEQQCGVGNLKSKHSKENDSGSDEEVDIESMLDTIEKGQQESLEENPVKEAAASLVQTVSDVQASEIMSGAEAVDIEGHDDGVGNLEVEKERSSSKRKDGSDDEEMDIESMLNEIAKGP